MMMMLMMMIVIMIVIVIMIMIMIMIIMIISGECVKASVIVCQKLFDDRKIIVDLHL